VLALLALQHEGKPVLLCVCGKEAVAAGFAAGQIIRELSPVVGGKGGGKPDSAMGGGPLTGKNKEVFTALKELIERG
jgi:alanyl-tRNA synthetase